ncbi:MAG: hypothetical protein QOE61_1978 [Micromonosporaceae bacterium]|nr:hypothetical protein [Micromonosporaceae bacterium]
MATWLRQCGHSVWLDEEQLVPGARFRTGLQQGLRESCHMVAVLTESYTRRPWTQRELDLFDLDADHGRRRLLAVQVDSMMNSSLDQILLVSQRIPWNGRRFDGEGLWKLHCGLTGQRPGPHEDWVAKGSLLLQTAVLASTSEPRHPTRITHGPPQNDSVFGPLRELTREVLAHDNSHWHASFAALRERVDQFDIGDASRELITIPWANGLAEQASIAALALVDNGRSLHVRGSTWSFIDLSCDAANHLLVGYQLATKGEPSEIWFSWAVWQRRWNLLPNAAASAPVTLRSHFAVLAAPAASMATSFDKVEADYDYGVMITPWNHFHLAWLAARLGDMPASISHLTALCSSTVRGDPRTGRFLNRLSTWPIFAAHREETHLRRKIEEARDALGLIPLSDLVPIRARLAEVWREVGP